ncbi:TolB family protein [Nocardioides sp. SYSU DS0663]|uniref:TolB family protein n=1 Tax=Nocardioides sp. SYSU DS0663 TaxID=3416445 RepID=UPI003F4C146C
MTSLRTRLLAPVTALALSLGTVAATAPPAAAESGGPDTTLVSAAADGGPADGWADRPQISGNGRYVTFDSNATNLTGGIPYPERRVYRRDLTTGTTQLVSATSSGAPANEWSSFSWPSDDGNLVAFVSDQFDLSTPTARARAVYVRDMAAGTTELVSVSSSEQPANGASSRPMISPDGRYVAFSSYASNLTPEGGNGQEQVFLRDRAAGTTTLVSVATDGGVGNKRSYRGMVSADGRFVAFGSFATDLVGGTNPDVESVFIRDLAAGTTQRVTVRSDGSPAPIGGARPYLSPDARYVVLNTYDPLVSSDTDTYSDVYVWDRTTGAMERQTVSTTGGDSNGDSLRGFITDDGRYTTFNSFATTLTDNDRNSSGDVFLRDRSTGKTTLLSLSWFGGGADGQSFRPVMSNDGSVVAYLSEARNLVEGDRSTDWQVYAVTTASVPTTADTTPASATVTSPEQGQVLPSPVTLRGTATDDRAVDKVFVQVRNNDTGLWLRPDGTWGSGAVRVPTTLANRYAASTGWSVELPLEPGKYGFEVVALDVAGNIPSNRPWTGFTVGTGETADTTAPTISVSTPQGGQTVPSPVTYSGTASDDRGVDRVFVQVRDNSTGLWLRPDGTWGDGARRIPVTLANPGATTTDWSIDLALDPGKYGSDVVAFDAASNKSDKPWTGFTVGTGETADTTAPTISVSTPQGGQTVPSPVTYSGTASDDRGVDRVFVQVRDNSTGLWLRPDGTWGDGARRIPVTLANPGATTTDWSIDLALDPGKYGSDVVAFDAAGNKSDKPWTSFSVGSADTTAPTVSTSSPEQGATVGSPVAFRGTASDDQGVDRVFVQVRDNSTGLWLRPDGTWGDGARRIPVTLANPGATTTDWSIDLALDPGKYGSDVVAFDAAGNKSDKPWTSFSVAAG